MSIYRASEEELAANRKAYMADYPSFVPRRLTSQEKEFIAESFALAVSTQNGQDFDDYSVTDNSRIEKYLKTLSPGKLLLLGTGTGREVRVAQDMGFDVIGTTLGSRNIEFGRRFLGLNSSNHIEAINEALPFGPNTFDHVVALQTFEHTMVPMMFLLEQTRVLKTGGTLLLEWPPGKTGQSGENPHHQVCFTPGQAYSLFQKAGLEAIELSDLSGPLPEEDIWRNDQNHYLICRGKKKTENIVAPYVRQYWSRKGI